MKFDVVVIGTGPGGYVASLLLAKGGLKVAAIEKEEVGGTCANVGCIPTKALIAPTTLVRRVRKASKMGLEAESVSLSWGKAVAHKKKVVAASRQGIQFLFKKYGVTLIKGEAEILSKNKVKVNDTEIEADKTVVATGTVAGSLPNIELDGETVISNEEALSLEKPPESMVIIGGGVMGLEFAFLFSAFGTKVTVIELLDRVLPMADEDISKELSKSLRAERVKVFTSSRVSSVSKQGQKAIVKFEAPDGEKTVEAEKVLLSVGRRISLPKGLREIGVEVERFVKVSDAMETTVEGVYAIGDVVGPLQLAHTAYKQAEIAASAILGRKFARFDPNTVPIAVFTYPEVGWVGKTEAQLKKEGVEYKVAKFPYVANGKARGEMETEGFAKVIYLPDTRKILGVHIVGAEASSLVHVASVAMSVGAKVDEVAEAIFAHPTYAEVLGEAFKVSADLCVHM